jgi:hypothetical protein
MHLNVRLASIVALLLTTVALAVACSACTGPADDATADDTGDVDAGALAESTCTARVVIAFYSDAACTQQVGQRAYDTAEACFDWVAQGSNAQENSASRFQCYRDRLCYTQFPNSLTCGDGGHASTDKQAKVGECLKEPSGSLYSRIVSGTEACPEAPAGFECPTSAAGEGNPAPAACLL